MLYYPKKEARLVQKGFQDNRFIAPENRYDPTLSSKATDIFAFGLVLWQIAAGKKDIPTPLPRRINDESETEIFNGYDDNQWINRESIPSDCPELFKTLIKKCWSLNPEDRPITNEIIKQLNGMIINESKIFYSEILSLCYKMTKQIQERRKEELEYIPPFLTANRLGITFDIYWKNI